MHVGSSENRSPSLTVHDTLMTSVEKDKYHRNEISADGKNTRNVAGRISKGIAINTQINQMLDMSSLGHHCVEIALLFREALLLNGILKNCEI